MSKEANKGKEPEKKDIETAEEAACEISEAVAEDAAEEGAAAVAEDTAEEGSAAVQEADAEEAAMDEVADEVINLLKKSEKAQEEEAAEEAAAKSDKSDKSAPKAKTAKQIAVENAKFRNLPFIEKCKRDPVIPVSILLAFIAILAAGIYFILPDSLYPSMGMTPVEFKKAFNSTEIANYLVSSNNFIGYGDITYVDPSVNPDLLGDKATVKGNLEYVDFFAGEAPNYSYSGVEGAARKTDGNIAYVRVYTLFDKDPVSMYLANTLQTLYPELSIRDAVNMALKIMNNYDENNDKFDVKGDYAIRLVPVYQGEVPYIVIDVLPRAAVRKSRIRSEIDQLTMPEDAADNAAESIENAVEST